MMVPAHRSLSLLATLGLSLLIVGCSSYIQTPAAVYQAPEHLSNQYTKVLVFDNADYYDLQVHLYQDPLKCLKPIALKAKDEPIAPGEHFTLYTQRGKPFTVLATFSGFKDSRGGGTYCTLEFTFTPIEDDYWLSFSADAGLTKCGYSGQAFTGDGRRKMSASEVTPRRAVAASDADGPWCEPI